MKHLNSVRFIGMGISLEEAVDKANSSYKKYLDDIENNSFQSNKHNECLLQKIILTKK